MGRLEMDLHYLEIKARHTLVMVFDYLGVKELKERFSEDLREYEELIKQTACKILVLKAEVGLTEIQKQKQAPAPEEVEELKMCESNELKTVAFEGGLVV